MFGKMKVIALTGALAASSFVATGAQAAGWIIGLVDGKSIVTIDPASRKVASKVDVKGAGPLAGHDAGVVFDTHAQLAQRLAPGDRFEGDGEQPAQRPSLAHDAAAAAAFTANTRGRWQCDLAALARRRLNAAGVTAVFGGSWCTYSDPLRFFSYRRAGQCGRMAALIWLE